MHASNHPCCKCNNQADVTTDFGFYCWGCLEDYLIMCEHCEELKEQNEKCIHCGK